MNGKDERNKNKRSIFSVMLIVGLDSNGFLKKKNDMGITTKYSKFLKRANVYVYFYTTIIHLNVI